jgi:hypothetical protein
MGDFKKIKNLSEKFIHKDRHKKIFKIKDKEERLIVLKNSLVSELRLKHLDFELKLKKLKDKKKRNLIGLKSNLIPSKINLLQVDFNEKDFKKINTLLEKLEEELSDA